MSSAELEVCKKILSPELGQGFEFGEIVKPGNRRFMLPPTQRLMRRMLAPLRLGNRLRQVMVEKHKAKGLLIHAAYRPAGGARLSQHKYARAFDFDLFPGDVERLDAVFYEEAVTLWCDEGRFVGVGLGVYCPMNVCKGRRVHIDVGGYEHSRHWQHGYKAGTSDVLLIADHLGLTPAGKLVPTESEDDDTKAEEGDANGATL